MGFEFDVAQGVRDARQNESLVLLLFGQECALIVHFPRYNLPRARGAGAGAARVRQVVASLLRGVQDVLVIRAFEGDLAFRGLDRDLVRCARDAPHAAALEPERLGHGHG